MNPEAVISRFHGVKVISWFSGSRSPLHLQLTNFTNVCTPEFNVS